MRQHEVTRLRRYLAQHEGVIGRSDAYHVGLTTAQVEGRLASGEWVRLYRGVYAAADRVVTPEMLARAAFVALGRRGPLSDRSAAFALGIIESAPARPALTVPLGVHTRIGGIEIHRRQDLDHTRVVRWRGLPVTDPVRTLAALGAVVGAGELDRAVDRALARRLVRVVDLEAEVRRLGRRGRRGRRGVTALGASLERRGLVGAPSPSVLESIVARLLAGWGIEVQGQEVWDGFGRYRLDFQLLTKLFLEVDGYAYHSSPEAKAYDSHRRNALRRQGIDIIESDWVTATRRPERLHAQVCAALEDHQNGQWGSTEVPPGPKSRRLLEGSRPGPAE